MKKFYVLLQAIFSCWLIYILYLVIHRDSHEIPVILETWFFGICFFLITIGLFQLGAIWVADREWKKIARAMHNITDAPNSYGTDEILQTLGSIYVYSFKMEWIFKMYLPRKLFFPAIEIIRNSYEKSLMIYLEAKERF